MSKTTARKPADAQRKGELACIHIARDAIRMDDDDYRAMLMRITGERSAATIGAAGRAAVIAELQRLGAPAPPSAPRRKAPRTLDRRAYLQKIGALLRDAGRTWEYADATAKRMFGIERVEFASDVSLRKLVAALSINARRNGRKPDQDR